jgi:hypothetical protein
MMCPATNDERVIALPMDYFRYQAALLPQYPSGKRTFLGGVNAAEVIV